MIKPRLAVAQPNSSTRARARGSRLDPTWLPDPAWHHEHGWTNAQAAYELEKFRDYWTAKTGQQATKLDWQATWRNWLRNAAPGRVGGGLARTSTTDTRVAEALALAERLDRRAIG